MRKGERNLLVPEFVRYFGNSSGSSNAGASEVPADHGAADRASSARRGTDGLLPLPRDARRRRVPVRLHARPLPADDDEAPKGPVLITSNPALMMTTHAARLASPSYLPRRGHPADRRLRRRSSRVIAERYLDHDVRAVAGTTCWFTLLFEKVLAEAKRRGRSARHVAEIWPNLRVPARRRRLGGAVPAGHPRADGPQRRHLVDTYNATEGGIYASADHAGAARHADASRIAARSSSSSPLEEHEQELADARPALGGRDATAVRDRRHDRLGPLRVQARRHRPLPVDAPLASSSWGASRAACRSRRSSRRTSRSSAPSRTRSRRCPCHDGRLRLPRRRRRRRTQVRATCSSSSSRRRAGRDLDAFARAFDEGLCEENRVYREHRKGDVALLRAAASSRSGRAARKRFLEEVTRGNVQGKFPRIIDDTKRASVTAYAESKQLV